MNLQDFASLAEVINALAVIVTLVVLIVSIRQNTQAQRVLAVQSLATAIATLNVPAGESPALGSAIAKTTKDWNSATRDERIVAHYFMFAFFKMLETGWYQRKSGTLDQEQWSGWEQMLLSYYHSPGLKAGWWPRRAHAFSAEFRDYLAASAPPQTFAPISDVFDDAPAPSVQEQQA